MAVTHDSLRVRDCLVWNTGSATARAACDHDCWCNGDYRLHVDKNTPRTYTSHFWRTPEIGRSRSYGYDSSSNDQNQERGQSGWGRHSYNSHGGSGGHAGHGCSGGCCCGASCHQHSCCNGCSGGGRCGHASSGANVSSSYAGTTGFGASSGYTPSWSTDVCKGLSSGNNYGSTSYGASSGYGTDLGATSMSSNQATAGSYKASTCPYHGTSTFSSSYGARANASDLSSGHASTCNCGKGTHQPLPHIHASNATSKTQHKSVAFTEPLVATQTARGSKRDFGYGWTGSTTNDGTSGYSRTTTTSRTPVPRSISRNDYYSSNTATSARNTSRPSARSSNYRSTTTKSYTGRTAAATAVEKPREIVHERHIYHHNEAPPAEAISSKATTEYRQSSQPAAGSSKNYQTSTTEYRSQPAVSSSRNYEYREEAPLPSNSRVVEVTKHTSYDEPVSRSTREYVTTTRREEPVSRSTRTVEYSSGSQPAASTRTSGYTTSTTKTTKSSSKPAARAGYEVTKTYDSRFK
ncbi:hypothetical protein CAPTEDRAFT_202681 [Capitella teleta]|uniref:Uncharacterized protein n=1 Tax=Capitella teleta TaxID=283909 RepID=R7TPB6_CAPTE|nr:hypothetical protein CAPTEDRAFT_202681 [Capitella teleta]|eukprot:ELT93336.1 hypothetical protein CAPTEDRAFT_202681 [Capitella teleta]